MKYLYTRVICALLACGALFGCHKRSNIQPQKEHPQALASSNVRTTASISQQSMLAATLLNTQWRTYFELPQMSTDDMANTMIVELNKRTANDIASLTNINQQQLAAYALAYDLLRKAGIRSAQTLKEMSLPDIVNTLIVENSLRLEEYSVPALQQMPVQKLVQLGYSWYLPQAHAPLLAKLANATQDPLFAAKDSANRGLDVLKIVATERNGMNGFKYLGTYHVHTNGDNFNLVLGASNDLKNWVKVVQIDVNAHQGDIVKWGNGYLITYEEDKQQGANNIRLRYYDSYEELVVNRFSFDKKLERQIGKNNVEGTPDIRALSGTSPLNGSIALGFHYYDQIQGVPVDKLAFGVLTNGSQWNSWQDAIANYNLREMDFRGNIGSRKSFQYQGQTLTLQEAQKAYNSWDTWNVMLGEGGFYTRVNIQTPLNATSFANPSITHLSGNEYVITCFMPSEGNLPSERGTLIYEVNL
ncbi:hypothetical protein [Microscilla marina]|uniref:Lipoprotein, putative n=1 Tax=Microscilla marina ATCC 23134 TaxID=313606 RepID=A1ZNX7_MICM2|nr:hypothetical protein [Microscilla marina]EAY28016.1 lipoprotein, putative [Microscilla marina ATCC 23134]